MLTNERHGNPLTLEAGNRDEVRQVKFLKKRMRPTGCVWGGKKNGISGNKKKKKKKKKKLNHLPTSNIR